MTKNEGLNDLIKEAQNNLSRSIFKQQNAKTEVEFVKARELEKEYRDYIRVFQNARAGSNWARVSLAHNWGIGDCPGCTGCK